MNPLKIIPARQSAKPVSLENIHNIRVASPCPADWNKMIGDERTRHCAECNLKVYNLSAMTEREVQKLIARSQGRLCARFYRRADGTILTQDCPRGLRAVAQRVSRTVAAVLSAVMSVGFAFAGTKPQQSSQPATQNEHSVGGVFILITDPQGAVVSGANVTLVKQEDKKNTKPKTGTTDSSGHLFLTAVPTGQYELEVKFRGFRTFRQTVPVREGKLESIRLSLRVSESTEVIEVGDIGPALVQTESTITTTFDRPSLEIPLPSRGGFSPIRQ
ncbi:MAG TPA: carboxypeptidase-like regulatory domain-containing protein [Candidatus Angelobacter sp.]|nr:carboxypeptidase-like regulatory domain-containing protein [Candidatus Angelobacter sp.]